MSILKYEFYKIMCKKLLLLLILALFLVNGYMYINEHTNDGALTPEVYYSLEKEYAGLPPDQAVSRLAQEEGELSALGFIRYFRSKEMQEELVKEQISPMLEQLEKPLSYEGLIAKYKDSRYMNDGELLNDYCYSLSLLKEKLQYIKDYPGFIDSMEEKAREMQSVSIFNKPGTFSYRNTVKTPGDFEHLKGIKLKPGDQKGIVTSTKFGMTDIVIIALIFLLCIYLFLHEKENGLINLMKACENGRIPVILSKLAVLALAAAALSAVFYGSVLILGSRLYGFGDGSRYVQSMSAFRDCSLLLTVKEYIILFIFTKVLTAVLTSLVFAMLFNVLSNAKAIYIGLGLFMGASYMCYAFIHPASYINVFKYLNIFAFFNVFGLYGEYTNINLFGFPVSTVFASLLVFLIISPTACLINIFAYSRLYTGPGGMLDMLLNKLSLKRARLSGNTSLFRHEAYKVFIAGKVYLVILIALVISYGNIDFTPLLMGQDVAVYKSYVDSMAGGITPEKTERIKAERKRFDDIPLEIEKLNISFKNGAITGQELSYKLREITLFAEMRQGFDRLENQYQYLVDLKKDSNINGSFVCELSSDYIFNNKTRDLFNGLLYCILLILCISNIFPMDYRNGMINILKCTRHGRLKLFAYKSLIGGITALILLIIVYSPYYINLLTKYDIKDWSAPIQSIRILGGADIDISISGFIVLANLLQLGGCLAMTAFILLISQLVKKQSFCIFAATVLFGFPFLMGLMGMSSVNSFTLNTSFLLFSSFAGAAAFGGLTVYFTVLGILAALAVAWGGCIYNGNEFKTHKLKGNSTAAELRG
ncbi:hypothetical protein DFR58_1055 [Anaerobacterium chartisolvens]|uniref:ABC-2 family transporter n=1 Tax=Anaerobacterium chartisolvens TaxID=1297424 RepID=A0A369BCS5_9FIRM|nr:hypothetical protein [Anaerobacterium chartisolvens]RCX18247.1 hypothetical protein DFR58_1055 [Anaerobacterium chartisolvens]